MLYVKNKDCVSLQWEILCIILLLLLTFYEVFISVHKHGNARLSVLQEAKSTFIAFSLATELSAEQRHSFLYYVQLYKVKSYKFDLYRIISRNGALFLLRPISHFMYILWITYCNTSKYRLLFNI